MARPSYPSDNVDKLLLRFPEGMRERIKAAADASGRSMNAEIVHRLEYSFLIRYPLEETRSPQVRIAELAAKIIELSRRVVDESALNLSDEEQRYLQFLGETSQISQAELIRKQIREQNEEEVQYTEDEDEARSKKGPATKAK